MVYDITHGASFEEIDGFRKQMLRAKDVDWCPAVLVGNKCDLESERQVSNAEGSAKATDELVCPFIETSAKQRKNVDEAFATLVRTIRGGQQGKDKDKKKSSSWKFWKK
jgi:GTPase KRas protein